MAPSLTKFAAERAKEKSRLLKEGRLLREERQAKDKKGLGKGEEK